MNYLLSQEDLLSYKISLPKSEGRQCCVVFVHAAEGNKLGPHRMFVEFERILNNSGLSTLRFDFAGCGDSTGTSEYDGNRDLRNIDDVVGFLVQEKQFDDIVLLGMSRGAYAIHEYLKSYPKYIKGAILLSTPTTSISMIKRVLKDRIKEYLLKLASKETYVKFFRNQINYRLVFQTIFQVFSEKRQYSSNVSSGLPDYPVLLIYGENDPMTSESMSFYLPLFETASSDVVCKVIKRANHSFFHYKWKEEIQEIVLNWLKERF